MSALEKLFESKSVALKRLRDEIAFRKIKNYVGIDASKYKCEDINDITHKYFIKKWGQVPGKILHVPKNAFPLEVDYPCIYFNQQNYSAQTTEIIFEIKERLLIRTGTTGGHIEIFFDSTTKEDALKICEKFPPKDYGRASLKFLAETNGTLFFREVNLNDHNFDPNYYNDDFLNYHNGIVNWIDDWSHTNKSLTILHSEPGTGKTSYLRTLTKYSKNLVYIPPNLTNIIGEPKFLDFLMSNTNNVFLIEDAENILINKSNRNPALQNLLNASDGLLGDAIRSKFILTFNANINDIDPAILRPGRLHSTFKLDKLTTDKVRVLFERLDRKETPRPMTLAEVFNAKPSGLKFIEKEERKVGFQ